MKVIYGNFSIKGENMMGREVEMTEDEARPLIASNIVREIETTSIEPSENAMVKRPRRRHVTKNKNRTNS